MSIVLYPYNGQVDEVPRPVEETTGATSISGEGAFFTTSDVSDDVATVVVVQLFIVTQKQISDPPLCPSFRLTKRRTTARAV
jgi:hypothetical protein